MKEAREAVSDFINTFKDQDLGKLKDIDLMRKAYAWLTLEQYNGNRLEVSTENFHDVLFGLDK